MIAAIVFGGRLLLRPALRWIARSDTPEIFTAAALLLVVATAALMQSVGLSMALGAFLAGVLLAESEYRRELETDLEPFKGLLLGLFFIAVGMSIDFAVVLAQPAARRRRGVGFPAREGIRAVGHGAHDAGAAARAAGVRDPARAGRRVRFRRLPGRPWRRRHRRADLVAAASLRWRLSMLLTPLLLVGADRWWAAHLKARPRRAGDGRDQRAAAGADHHLRLRPLRPDRGRLINANGLSATVLDHDAEQVATVRRFGWPAFYGDATRLDLLRTAGAGEARVIVVAIDDVEQSLKVVDTVREHFAHATIVARARNVTHWYGLHARGVQCIERETFDAALMSGRSVLELMGWERHAARNQALRFRQHNIELMTQMAPHHGDEKKLISMSKQGSQELQALWSREREQQQRGKAREGWHAPHRTDVADGADASD